MMKSSVKSGHLAHLDLKLNKHSFPLPTIWGHLAHFELGSTTTITKTKMRTKCL